jgi:acid phosphatase type 7
MTKFSRHFGLFIGVFSVFTFATSWAQEAGRFDPVGIYLTWQRDPATTMTIDWHTVDEAREARLDYRLRGTEEWSEASGTSHPFPFSDRTIHRVELTGLQPASVYEFRWGPNAVEYSFRTMPTDASRPIRFAVGGDTRHRKDWMEETNREVLRFDPDFVLWGGDLAYADGREDRVKNWHEWFDAIKSTLVTEQGRVTPVLVTIGNHEVRRGYYWQTADFAFDAASRERIAPYFYRLFAMPGQPGYNVLDFGDYMSIILLDSNHTNPVRGEQSTWLARTLVARSNVPHLFPIYHVAAYPSHRRFDGRTETEVRENWVPLFERFGVRVAFENHDHTYKRTHPIRAGKVDPSGVVYLGDGAWGVSTRKVHNPAETWYLKRAESVRNFIIVTVHGTHQHFLMLNHLGKVIDEYPESPRLPARHE